MGRYPTATAVYEVADLFRNRCLLEGASLLWPSELVWTIENLTALYDAFIRDPDTGEDTFYIKWERQLKRLPPTVHRIATDVIAFYLLFPMNIGAERKLADIRTVISWKLADDTPDLAILEKAFANPVGSAGRGYLMRKPWQVAFYIDFARGIKSREADPHDPSACKLLADKVKSRVQQCNEARHILLHLLFPDEFEPITNSAHKEQIVQKFLSNTSQKSDPQQSANHVRGH